MEECDVVTRALEHAVEWSADEFAAADESDFGRI